MSRNERSRPLIVEVFTGLLGLAAVLTCYAGLSASGFLIPAACLLLAAVLVWSGRGRRLFTAIIIVNLVCGIGQDLVLAFGDALGRTKLDVAGVAMLLNLLCGGPLMSLLGLPLLAALRWSTQFRSWFVRSDVAVQGAAVGVAS